MLSLKSPPVQVGTMVLYPDHQDPLTYYYSAGQPRIALYENKALMYALYIYRDILHHSVFTGTTIPDEMGAGFLTIGVDCRRDEDELKKARDALADIMHVEAEKIKLAPIPYKDGSVSLIGLDSQDAATPPPPAVTDNRPQFVRHVMGSTRPALLGDLRSIFSVSLSDKGAAFMAGVHGTGALPFGVSYDLTFEGLRPSVDATVSAETSQIRTYFGGGIQGQYQFFKADISAGIEKMQREGKVKIELISQQTGAAAEESKKRALDLFKERIIQDLFNPGLPAVPSAAATPATTPAALTAAANSLAQTATSSSGSITLSLKAEMSTTTGTLLYNFSESAPEEHRDAPNAFLQALMDVDQLKKSITLVDLGQSVPFFNNLEIVVSAPSKDVYDALKIARITVDVFYGAASDAVPPETKSLVFTPDGTRDRTVAFSRSGRNTLLYTYTVKYDFLDDENITADALRYVTAVRQQRARTLSINPQDDFRFSKITVRAGQVDSSVALIIADLATAADENGFIAQKTLRFIPPFDNASSVWYVRSLAKAPPVFTVNTRYAFTNDELYTPPPIQHSGSLLTLDDPFHAKRELLIIPNIVSENVDAVEVEVEYDDKDSTYVRHFFISLRPPFSPQSLVWPIVQPEVREIKYRATVHENGLSETSEFAVSDDPSITVGASLVLMDKVSVRLIGGTLAAAGFDAVVIDIKMKDEEGHEKISSLVFAEGEAMVQTLPLVRRPDEAPAFAYRIQTFKTDGSQNTTTWTDKVGNPLLIISIRNL